MKKLYMLIGIWGTYIAGFMAGMQVNEHPTWALSSAIGMAGATLYITFRAHNRKTAAPS